MNADHVAHNAVVSLLWGATGHATIARAATRGATGSNAGAMTLSSTWDAIESPGDGINPGSIVPRKARDMTSLYRTTEPPTYTSLRRTGHARAFSVTMSKDHAGRWHWQVDWAVQYPSGSMARWERTGAANTRKAAWDAALKEVEDERTFDSTDGVTT